MSTAIQSDRVRLGDHTTHFLHAGPRGGTPLVFVHGWPELARSWRHQLPFFAGRGFRVIAPDMRGYGESSCYPRFEDHALEHLVGDLVDLLDHLDIPRAVWIGHDWGSPVAWAGASHHPERCLGVASLCVPYFTLERGLEACLPLIDRTVYPADQFPAGQWEYQLYYQEHFERATAVMDADPARMLKALFRRGSAKGRGKPAPTAFVRRTHGWFNGADAPPDVPLDTAVIDEEELRHYAAALARNGFFGPNAYYMNHARNAEYTARAGAEPRLAMPVLFLAAAYDYTCESIDSRLAEPMRALCDDLDEVVVESGHWMAQEKPEAVNQHLLEWLERSGVHG